ncbi:MAG: TonB family protein [Bacteroidetes bacterium]|nr:TonB family protein [Bacteroidota bacterium]
MQRTFFSFTLLFFLSTTAWSQISNAPSRGFIPPLFTLPGETEEIRFTSAAQPRFMLPDYPEEQLNQGIEGVVEVMVYVTSEGDVVYSEVTVSSSVDAFDKAALASAMKTEFPEGYATVRGLPRDFRLAVPYYFLLSADPENYWQSRLELARVRQEYEQVMTRFEDYLMARTVASESKMHEIQRQMEEKVAAAKSIHRLLAEKKEEAILRLRQEIDDTRSDSAPVADADDSSWRRSLQDHSRATVQAGAPGSSVINERVIGAEGMERLTQELEMKKSYL